MWARSWGYFIYPYETKEIEPTTSYPKFHPNQKRFLLEGCRNVDIERSDLTE